MGTPSKNKLDWRDIDNNTVDIITSYTDCYEQMIEIFPNIEKERSETRKMLMIILTNPMYVRGDDCFIFPVKILKHLGINPTTFNNKIKKYPFFVRKSNYYSKANKKAIQYEATEHYAEFLKSMNVSKNDLQKRLILALMDEERIDIEERELINYRIRQDYAISNIDINYENILNVIPKMNEQTSMAGRLLINNYSSGYEVYKHYDCGRYFSTLGVSFQNIDRRIRNAAFEGMYNYDFSNCHYVVMEQFLPNDHTLKRYNSNPKGEQKRLMELYGIDKLGSKRLFLSILYGVSSKFKETHAWKKYFDIETVELLLQDEFVKDMFKMRNQLRKVLKNTEIVEHREPKQLLPDVAFLYENEMLMILASHCTPQVLLFDGLITKDCVNVEKVEKEILNTVGIEIKITEELIGGEKV